MDSEFSNLSATAISYLMKSESDSGNGTIPTMDIASDFWSLANADNLRQDVGWSTVLVLSYLIILLVGTIGNFFVILVILHKPPMKAVTNMFLINLAVADLLVSVFCVPATLLANLFIPWILGSFMCKGVAYVQGVSVCASAYSLAALSLDRCKAIYRPMKRHQGISKNQALITILLIWIFALLITLPWLFVFEVVKVENDDQGQVYCLEAWENEHMGKLYFLVANLLCGFSVPMVLICFSNIAIWYHVYRREVPQDSVSVRRMHRRTRNGVRKTLSFVTAAFIISWLPLYALAARLKFASVGGIGEWEGSILSFLLPVAQWMGSLNSSMNPVLYCFVNSKFRKGFHSLLYSPFKNDNFESKSSSSSHRQSQKLLLRKNAVRQRIVTLNRIGNVGSGV